MELHVFNPVLRASSLMLEHQNVNVLPLSTGMVRFVFRALMEKFLINTLKHVNVPSPSDGMALPVLKCLNALGVKNGMFILTLVNALNIFFGMKLEKFAEKFQPAVEVKS